MGVLNKLVHTVSYFNIYMLLLQVAQIYQCIEFARLRQLLPFVSAFELERIVVQAAKNIDLPVSSTIKFATTSLGVCLTDSLASSFVLGTQLSIGIISKVQEE